MSQIKSSSLWFDEQCLHRHRCAGKKRILAHKHVAVSLAKSLINEMSSKCVLFYDTIRQGVDLFFFSLLLYLSRSRTVQWPVSLRLWDLMCGELLHINLENRPNGQVEYAPQDL
jgi:hypothetical protein